MSNDNWIMDIHIYEYTIRYGYIHYSITDIDNSITDIHNYFWINIIRGLIHVWLSITEVVDKTLVFI